METRELPRVYSRSEDRCRSLESSMDSDRLGGRLGVGGRTGNATAAGCVAQIKRRCDEVDLRGGRGCDSCEKTSGENDGVAHLGNNCYSAHASFFRWQRRGAWIR